MYMARIRVSGLLSGFPCTEAGAALDHLVRVGIEGVRRIKVILKTAAKS